MRRKNTNKTPPKSRHVDLRIDQSTYDKIENSARAANLSVSEYIRQMLVKGTVTVKYEHILEAPLVRQALAELGHIGGNLNQIAHHLNSGGTWSLDMHARTINALSDIYDLKKEIQRLGGGRFGGT